VSIAILLLGKYRKYLKIPMRLEDEQKTVIIVTGHFYQLKTKLLLISQSNSANLPLSTRDQTTLVTALLVTLLVTLCKRVFFDVDFVVQNKSKVAWRCLY